MRAKYFPEADHHENWNPLFFQTVGQPLWKSRLETVWKLWQKFGPTFTSILQQTKVGSGFKMKMKVVITFM